ncbi:hypothetical protein L6452_23382 [Arctium lappa]|uniref:Uncharacterized protein n=1 Tax=Arctium lappa TaxID=4217 RepID=A0ACB9B1A6_ARCLA|nr:hypothetical protein L6452_23382 [Arctium lappa]
MRLNCGGDLEYKENGWRNSNEGQKNRTDEVSEIDDGEFESEIELGESMVVDFSETGGNSSVIVFFFLKNFFSYFLSKLETFSRLPESINAPPSWPPTTTRSPHALPSKPSRRSSGIMSSFVSALQHFPDLGFDAYCK